MAKSSAFLPAPYTQRDIIPRGSVTRWPRQLIPLILSTLIVAYWVLIRQSGTFSNWRGTQLLEIEEAKPELQDVGFRWGDVAPSNAIHYTPCFISFLCARLSVPLNWNTTAEEQRNGPRAEIAVIKLPARVPVTDPRYGGPIILNPGGPGESGVHQVINDGQSLQHMLDVAPDATAAVDHGKYFDIMSFDPRGVNNTTPKLRCFSGAFDQQAWLQSLPDYGMLWSSESVTGMEWSRAEAHGVSCSHGEDDSGILRHLNTAQTVEDMVYIVEKEAEWRAYQAERLVLLDDRLDPEEAHEALRRTAHRPGEEKIQYWGMSYGTLIGSTFAATHPSRVGRIVIDGVVDPADHYAGRWLTQLQDSDTIISKFCEYCFQSGPSRCPIYTGTSAKDVEDRLTSIMLTLRDNPIAIPPSSETQENTGPGLVLYGDAHLALLSCMYFPFAMAEVFFDLLAAVESRNTSSPTLRRIVANKQKRHSRAGCKDEASREIPYVSGMGAFQAISCMDTGGVDSLTRDAFNEYVKAIQGQGRWISLSWAQQAVLLGLHRATSVETRTDI